MGYTIADCILIPLILVGLFFTIRWLFRFARKATREVLDCAYVARRGVLTPIQVREEFIATMGREPTIAEVRDLQDMIKTEHAKAVKELIGVGVGIVGSVMLFHRALNKGGY